MNRRPVIESDASNKKVEEVIVAMDDIERECYSRLQGFDALFITMGVGQSSKATREELRTVDVDYPTLCARGARRANVKHVSILTAVDADSSSEEVSDTIIW